MWYFDKLEKSKCLLLAISTFLLSGCDDPESGMLLAGIITICFLVGMIVIPVITSFISLVIKNNVIKKEMGWSKMPSGFDRNVIGMDYRLSESKWDLKFNNCAADKTIFTDVVRVTWTACGGEKIHPRFYASNAWFRNSSFARSSIFHLTAQGTHFEEANFSSFESAYPVFSQGFFTNTNFTKATMPWCDFKQAFGERTIFTRASLANGNFQEVKMRQAQFDNANLTKAIFRDAKLNGSSFKNAKMVKADCRGADFTNAYLSDADLSGADLTNANFTNAYLIDVNLTGAIIHGAIFNGAITTGTTFPE